MVEGVVCSKVLQATISVEDVVARGWLRVRIVLRGIHRGVDLPNSSKNR